MRKCPKCSKPVDDGASACASCGAQLSKDVSATLDADLHFGGGAADEKSSAEQVESPSEPHAESAAGGTLEIPDAGEMTPVDPKGLSSSKTVHDIGKTVGEGDEDEPIDDTDFSIAMDDQPANGTVRYSDDDIDEAKTGQGKSGTAGRLKRLWMGAAGSSSNPMHTLKGADALATDSVFDRVASRVLVAHTDIKVKDISGTSSKSQPDRQTRVAECIEEACRGADNDAADYDLTGFLGQGGMGVVLKARQRAIGRDVALKMVQPSKGDSSANTLAQQKKFFYEAQITGKLDHPNIVPIYELGISNDILFYSMKMIIGTEWKDVIETNSRDENLDILMKILDAMAFAHEKGVIHRDLKPENVMLGPFGEVLVTDWGCAVDLARNEKFTGAGSPPWMAPEMASHNIDKIGPKSDIYLLGAMLYQIIAGYPPHPGRSVWECIQAAAKNVILPLKIEDPLLDIALRAMETEPDDRYLTVEAMQEAIREYRRHAESITLTDRSDTLVEQAITSKDYERFSRAVFGYHDAIDLWPENKAAHSGLQKARFAHGQCAFDKGDFDLCLQVLDQQVPAEAKLYAEALKAKKASEERENRFKALRKILAAVVLFAVVGLSLLTGVAFWQKGRAEKSEGEAIASANAAAEAKQKAEDAEKEALRQKENAELATKDAIKQKKDADKARQEAVVAKDAAVIAKDAAQAAERDAVASRIAADKARDAKEIARKEAENQRLLAEQRTLEVELGSYQSKLSLAMNQVQQRNVGGSRLGLAELATESTFKILNERRTQPKFDNWALNRVKLLTNSDLLQASLGDHATAVTFAENANRGIAATCTEADRGGSGQLHIVHLNGSRIVVERTVETLAAVDSLAISADGMQVAFALTGEAGLNQSKIYTWDLSAGQSEPVEVAQQSSLELQGMAISKNRLVGGINGGMHVWSRNQNVWKHQLLPRVKGRLRSLQMLGESNALVLAEIDGKATAYNVNLDDGSKRASLSFDMPEDSEIAAQQISALAYSNGRLILGTDSGQLFTTRFAINASTVGPDFQEIEPRKHQSAIRSIRVHSDGTLLTVAAEPVAHVWQTAAKESGWKYATFLAGTTSNLADAAFMANSSLVLAVGEDGTPILWDVQRQQQRQQLRRVTSDGSELIYSSPVQHVVTSNDSQRAVSIHRDGTIDAWDLQTGKTLGESEIPFEYVGHTPGAKFEDMAIDTRAGVLITSAVLPGDGSDAQLRSGERQWEYCKWDLAKGEMLDRWTRKSATPQQISLLDAGKLVLYASNVATTLAETKNEGAVEFESEQFSSFFAVENPAAPNLAMLVKSNGAVRVFDRSDKTSFDALGYKLDVSQPENVALLSNEDVPLVGRWSSAGDRFYMVWRSGRITEFAWENSQLSIKRDLRDADLVRLGIQFDAGEGATSEAGLIRLQTREQLDVRVQSVGRNNLLYYAVRFPGVEGRTRLVRVVFPLGEGNPAAEKAEEAIGRFHLVLDDDASPIADKSQLAQLPISAYDVASVRHYGETTYFATASGIVYTLSHQGSALVLGRPELLDGTGNAAADRIVTLHKGGVMWRGDEKDGVWTWSPLAKAPETCENIAMSPSGSQLLLTVPSVNGTRKIMVADAVTGEVQEVISGAVRGSWSPAGELALITEDGSIRVREAAGEREIGKLQRDWEPQSLHFFVEAWEVEQPATPWLVVHAINTSSTARDGKLEYFALTPQADVVERSASLAPGTQVLACSPSEGIFVTGGYGQVEVHFATPTLGELDKVLFSLEGHAGAEIECLTFSRDGKTLISTDSKSRQFAWLSEDTLQGVIQFPAASPVAVQ